MTSEPLLLTVLTGNEPESRIIRISKQMILFNREPLQQQSLPTGGRDPIEVHGYKNGWEIDLQIDREFAATVTTLEFENTDQHAIALKIFNK